MSHGFLGPRDRNVVFDTKDCAPAAQKRDLSDCHPLDWLISCFVQAVQRCCPVGDQSLYIRPKTPQGSVPRLCSVRTYPYIPKEGAFAEACITDDDGSAPDISA